MSIPVGIKIHMVSLYLQSDSAVKLPLAEGSYRRDLGGELNKPARGRRPLFGLSFVWLFGVFSSTSRLVQTEQTRQTGQSSEALRKSLVLRDVFGCLIERFASTNQKRICQEN